MGANRNVPVRYLPDDPGEWGEVYLEQPPCPTCGHGWLTREIVDGGEMLICTGTAGCGQRYWFDRPRLHG